MIPGIFNIILVSGYVVLIIYYHLLWKKVPHFSFDVDYVPKTKVSVIIPARNEAANILRCINAILNQTYPTELLEIIVVDDFSEDETQQIVRTADTDRVRLITGSEGNNGFSGSGKKMAIAKGISQSSGNLIITTDADCIAGENWIKTIVCFYEKTGSQFIAAPVRMSHAKSALSVFQILDFITLQGIGAAAVHHRFHLLSNGANLAYEKKIFNEVNGFEGIDSIASGDDILLMHKIEARAPDKIGYCLSDQAIVETCPEPGIYSFFQQRIRWASKARFYPDKKITAVLIWVLALNALVIILFIAGFFDTRFFYWCISTVLVKTFVELIFLIPVAGFFRQQHLVWFFLPAQPFHIIYTVIAGFFGQITKYRWKGRNLK